MILEKKKAFNDFAASKGLRSTRQRDIILDGRENSLFFGFRHEDIRILFDLTGENRCNSISYPNNS